jgi:hypothetical protein
MHLALPGQMASMHLPIQEVNLAFGDSISATATVAGLTSLLAVGLATDQFIVAVYGSVAAACMVVAQIRRIIIRKRKDNVVKL